MILISNSFILKIKVDIDFYMRFISIICAYNIYPSANLVSSV